MASLDQTSKLFNQQTEVAEKSVKPIVTKGPVRTIAADTYTMTVQSINLGFSLAAALAWNEAVKKWIEQIVGKRGNEGYMLFVYALVVSLLAAIVFTVTRNFLDDRIKKQPIQPVLIATR